MKLSMHNRLVIGGFITAYLAGMAAMIVRSTERLAAYQDLLLWKLLVPLVGFGLLLILIGKLSPITKDHDPH